MNTTVSTSVKAFFLSLSLLLLASCGGGGSNGSPAPTQLDLPTGTDLTLSCLEVGIADNTCVLDDPDNPFRFSVVNDETKWDLVKSVGTEQKALFYLWATALAQQQKGENQYYAALALHALYDNGGSINAKNQAIKAYRSVLDNYFGDVTYRDYDGDGKSTDKVFVRHDTGIRLVAPTELSNLFSSETQAYDTLRSWGYDYTANTVSRL